MAKREPTIQSLWSLALLFATAATGVFIFLGAFPVIKVSPQNGLWGGITGVCMAIFSWFQIKKEVRILLSKEEDSAPKPTPS
jgi:hypothetical protein